MHGAWHTRVLHRGKAAAVPVGEMEHEAHRKPGSIGVQGAFASNSMHYTSLYTHHQLTTPHPGKRFLGLPLRAGSNIFRSRANAGFRSWWPPPCCYSRNRGFFGRRISESKRIRKILYQWDIVCRINEEIILCYYNYIVGFDRPFRVESIRRNWIKVIFWRFVWRFNF